MGDPTHLVRFDRVESGEERWHALGMAEGIVMQMTTRTGYELSAHEGPHEQSGGLTKMAISKEQRERLQKLAAMPDEAIDTSDIPEVTDWSGAVRCGLYKPRKGVITIRLDADVLAWFKGHAEGSRGYQSEINRVLREHVANKERRRA
jgi:uncharacterized protein (DUF4415 family)